MNEQKLRSEVAKRRKQLRRSDEEDVPDRTWEYLEDMGFVEEADAKDDPADYLVHQIDKIAAASPAGSARTYSKGDRQTRKDLTQGRAAALLPGDLMAALDEYYSPLETLLSLVGFANMVSDSFDRTLRGEFQEMRPDRPVALTRNPYREQLEKFLGAQESTPAKIEEYLARPRWGPLFLKADRWAKRRGQKIK